MAGSLLERAAAWFTVTPVDESAMRSAVIDAPRRGRFGLATRQDRAILDLRSDTVLPHLPPVGDPVRALDVSVLGAALEALCGIDTQAAAAGRLGYTTDAAAALAAVAGGTADAAFLVPPTSVHDVVVVAREGGIMPQKSTYFYPKALAGLVLNPHEW
jgi:hypothetical protein